MDKFLLEHEALKGGCAKVDIWSVSQWLASNPG